jgi:hypothetical protein
MAEFARQSVSKGGIGLGEPQQVKFILLAFVNTGST